MPGKTSPGSPGTGDLTLYRIPGSPYGISVLETVKPDYVLHRYTEEIYKLVRFRRSDYDGPPSSKKLDKDIKTNDTKLANNLSRARSMVVQYALCNKWDWFFTGTLSPEKFDRYNLASFQLKISQWIRDLRKRYGTQIQYLLVPERHKDGTWHMHGMLSNIPRWEMFKFSDYQYIFPKWFHQYGVYHLFPDKLCNGEYYCWMDYYEKFGYCSLGRVRDTVGCSFYISKYLSKDTAARGGDLGKHLYFHSRPLDTAVKVANSYGSQPELDKYLTKHYDFCDTGMIYNKDWSFPLLYPFDMEDEIEALEFKNKFVIDTQTGAIRLRSEVAEEEQTDCEICPDWAAMQMSLYEMNGM